MLLSSRLKGDPPMPQGSLFRQDVIALIWDFDRTLSPDFMQKPIFDAYGIDEDTFWREVGGLPQYYAKAGVTVQRDTCYVMHLLSYVQAGILRDLSNTRLEELGGAIRFFAGLPEAFDELRAVLDVPAYASAELKLEHYVVSTGLEAMIRGSAIYPHVDGIWASGFIETPAGPNYDPKGEPKGGVISQVAGLLDNTTKTRAIFEINKGVNVAPEAISVNDTIAESDRRVPIQQMIYIADGPSDVPSFSVVQQRGGRTLAVYDPDKKERLRQADELRKSGRVDMIGEADYRESSQTFRWLKLQIEDIAEEIVANRKAAAKSRVTRSPHH